MAEETKKTKKTGLSRFRKSKKIEEPKEEVAVEAAPVEEKTSPKVRAVEAVPVEKKTSPKVRAVVKEPKAKKVAAPKVEKVKAPKPEPKVVNWDKVRTAVHKAGWDTTVYPSDLDKVVAAAKSGGPDAVRGLKWLAAANRYAALVESFLK